LKPSQAGSIFRSTSSQVRNVLEDVINKMIIWRQLREMAGLLIVVE
jgi:hypothetical protein